MIWMCFIRFFDFNVQPGDLGFVCLQTFFWGLSLDIWGAGLGGGAWGIGSLYRFILTKNGTTRMSRFPSLSFTWPFWVNDEMIEWKCANSSIFRVGFLSWCQQIIKFTEKSNIQAWFFFHPHWFNLFEQLPTDFFLCGTMGNPFFLQPIFSPAKPNLGTVFLFCRWGHLEFGFVSTPLVTTIFSREFPWYIYIYITGKDYKWYISGIIYCQLGDYIPRTQMTPVLIGKGLFL